MARRDPLNELDPLNQETYERPRKAGKQPARPRELAKRMQQLIKESKQWARRCEEVWFDSGERIVENACAKSDPTKLLKQYNEAIRAFREVARWAAVGKKKLANGKKMVKERLPKPKPRGAVRV